MPDDQTHTARKIQPPERQALERTLRDALTDWIDAVNGGNADSIGALYTRDAVLLPTFDPAVRITPETRWNYFVNFKTRRKLHAVVDECHLTVLGDEAGSANGFYTFSFVDDNGASQIVPARFTFVYERQPEGDWLIVAHHSSVRPAL